MGFPESQKFDDVDEIMKLSKHRKISARDPNYENYTHCSHVMIFARTKSRALSTYDKIAIVLMQMRFDGFIGFPGGGVDPGESPVEAANREIREEAGWEEKNGPITDSHYQFTHVDEDNKLVLHFYAIEVSESKMIEIERNSLRATDYGEEVLGNFQVPLYTMEDSFRGFPAFLQNSFIGNAKTQLLESLINLNILTPETVSQALKICNQRY
ncbi:hypothetical protein RUM43_008330 [Polyplax serrata]|uniref:U8 snoRNA-decapping enzyme n=1 Tax=Polyplax serrata TaxID=468196 RepID=A0AAN8S2D7_POLSC